MSILGRATAPVRRRIDRHLDRRLRTELASTQEEVRQLKERLHGLDLLLGQAGRRVHRQPSPEEINELSKKIGEVTGEGRARRATIQAYRTLVEVENRGVGRIAGGTRNIVSKLATAPLLRPPNGDILEIGTLYGLFAGCLARQLLRAGYSYHLTIVDPISPVQLQAERQLKLDASGTPISEDVIRANLHYAGVLPDRLRLVPGRSGDPEVRETIGSGKFGVIVVDGDHSYEGVASDLEWVEEIAAPGAVVVIDDYGDRKWPGVKEATDERVASEDTRLTKLGQVTTSAFLRVN